MTDATQKWGIMSEPGEPIVYRLFHPIELKTDGGEVVKTVAVLNFPKFPRAEFIMNTPAAELDSPMGTARVVEMIAALPLPAIAKKMHALDLLNLRQVVRLFLFGSAFPGEAKSPDDQTTKTGQTATPSTTTP